MRAQHGLPTDPRALVFANFNSVFKFHPASFGAWLAILRAVPRAVLWVLRPSGDAASSAAAAEALLREAGAWGVERRRLVFAPVTSWAGHMRRLPAADLFLDTFAYNAHTSASDCLHAGVPLLTLAGATFQARV